MHAVSLAFLVDHIERALDSKEEWTETSVMPRLIVFRPCDNNIGMRLRCGGYWSIRTKDLANFYAIV